MSDEELKKIFDKEGGPEHTRSLEKFLLENGQDFKSFCAKRPKLQAELYELQIENQIKFVQRNRMLNNSKLRGFARKEFDDHKDRFVIARPSAAAVELVFSRQYQFDKINRHSYQRFFHRSQPLKWEFLPDGDNDCPCC